MKLLKQIWLWTLICGLVIGGWVGYQIGVNQGYLNALHLLRNVVK